MPKRIYKCIACGKYTLKTDKCPWCGGPVGIAHPPRFSLVDKYGKYRRIMRGWIEGKFYEKKEGEDTV